ncbi:MAG: DUF6629 family protein [Acetobacteraceae bacterium]|jgi:hypothetical protein
MCFSATASFVTAGLTGSIGIVSLVRVTEPRQLALAATPLFFASQQCVEGLLWLNLPVAPDGPGSAGLTLLFLVFAQVFWPVYAPFAVLLPEPNKRRRRVLLGCLAIGSGVGGWCLWSLLSHAHGAVIRDGHVVYVTEPRHSDGLALAYLAATCLPPLLSSWRTVAALGVIVLVGCVVAYELYWQAFASVWCFFAAAASAVILGHFEQSRWRHFRAAQV